MWERAGVPVTSLHHREHIAMLEQGFYAYIMDETSVLIHASNNCDMRVIGGQLFPLQYAMGFQKNSAYTAVFSEV